MISIEQNNQTSQKEINQTNQVCQDLVVLIRTM